MRRAKSMGIADSTASNLPLRATINAINLSLPTRNATLTSALCRQRSLFASSPRQNLSLERKRKELISKPGHNPLSKFVSEEFLSDPLTY